MPAQPVRRRSVNETKSNLSMFWILVILWFAFDRLTKFVLESLGQFGLTNTFFGIDGLFRLTLVHNTGGAWGMFSGNAFLLGVISLLISIFMCFYALKWGKDSNAAQIIGLALVVAGGLGNAFDRFLFGYVIDFINVTFVDFPVFNIADIGVTCGIVLFIIGLFAEWLTPEGK